MLKHLQFYHIIQEVPILHKIIAVMRLYKKAINVKSNRSKIIYWWADTCKLPATHSPFLPGISLPSSVSWHQGHCGLPFTSYQTLTLDNSEHSVYYGNYIYFQSNSDFTKAMKVVVEICLSLSKAKLLPLSKAKLLTNGRTSELNKLMI